MKEEAMKSLKQYLAESEKSYKFRLRSLKEISDEHMDRIESHMKKYNMESMSAFKKTIMQSKPRGFGDVGPNEVYISDMELNYQQLQMHCKKKFVESVVVAWAV